MFHTLVIFGGRFVDVPLATDFIKISKQFISDGLNPISISGTDQFTITNLYRTLRFGGVDLGRPSEPVYTQAEGASAAHFYRLAGPGGLKNDILSWIRDARRSVNRGDRVIIYICAHGVKILAMLPYKVGLAKNSLPVRKLPLKSMGFLQIAVFSS